MFTSFMGRAKMELGDYAGATRFFEQALRSGATSSDVDFLAALRDNLGCAQLQMGRVSEAVSNFDCALALRPTSAEAYTSLYNNLGRAFLSNRQPEVTVEVLQKGMALAPDNGNMFDLLGEAHFELGHAREALGAWERALKSRPNWTAVQQELAWLLATSPDAAVRDGARAVSLAQAADEESRGQSPAAQVVLAAAEAETGNYAEAKTIAGRARQLALSQGNAVLAASLEQQLSQYEKGKPWREAK
jgi:tetratricopeptide (TPR) repeat protein